MSGMTTAFSAHGATGIHITLAAGWNSVFNGDVTASPNDSVLFWTRRLHMMEQLMSYSKPHRVMEATSPISPCVTITHYA